MSLNSAFQIGRSALGVSQLALQTAGNNMANAATPGYSRQVASVLPVSDQNVGGLFVGRGVSIGGIRRQVDLALQSRLQSSISQQAHAQTNLELLASVEASLGELSGTDVGSQLSAFFNSWSNLASAPTDPARRSLVVQQGQTLASRVREVRTALVNQRTQIDRDLGAVVAQADDLLTRIASLNAEIVIADGGRGSANTLRDQRDTLVSQLAGLIDITTIDQPTGAQNILIGSTPVVLEGRARGIEVRQTSTATGFQVSVATKDNQEVLEIQRGRIGALLSNRATLVDDTLTRLDALASQVIFQVNRAHSTGTGTTPLSTVTGTRSVGSTDFALALNDPANQTLSALPFRPVNGSLVITVASTTSPNSVRTPIQIDLDGLDSTGAPGFADDTSLNTLVAALNSVGNITATITPDGRLQVSADAGYALSFSEDTSGVLATLGVNTYFTGSTAQDIGVRSELVSAPGLLSSGGLVDGQRVENAAARAIADLRDLGLAALGGATLTAYWDDSVATIATRTGAARSASEASAVVRESLEAQRSAISGVNIDEEAINLLTFQRQYQASARFITTVDEMTQTLLTLLR